MIGKCEIFVFVNLFQLQHLRTQIKGSSGREKQLGHHVLLTTGKDEINIWQELDVGA